MALSTARPLFTARPTRFSGCGSQRARLLLAAIALLLVACLTALPVSIDPVGQSDELRQGGIVEALRHGGDYYTAAASALRADDAPLRPFLAVRLPALAIVESLASPMIVALALYALALLTLVAWWRRLGAALARTVPRVAALLLAAGGMVAALQGEMAAVHAIWAGLLIALALVARRPGRWTAAAALGLSAMLLHEAAALFVILMTAIALVEREWREAAGWAATLLVFAVALALHAQAVAEVARPLDAAWAGWFAVTGFGFAARAIVATTALALLPVPVGALLVGLALAGWAAWRDPLATRALATLLMYLLFLSFVAGDGDAALLVAPFVLVGLAFAPDAIRDLARAALDRRRITVTRVAR